MNKNKIYKSIHSIIAALIVVLVLSAVSCVSRGRRTYSVANRIVTVEVIEGTVELSGEKVTNLNYFRNDDEEIPLDNSPRMFESTLIPRQMLHKGEKFSYKVEYGSSVTIRINDLGNGARCSVTGFGKDKSEVVLEPGDMLGKTLHLNWM